MNTVQRLIILLRRIVRLCAVLFQLLLLELKNCEYALKKTSLQNLSSLDLELLQIKEREYIIVTVSFTNKSYPYRNNIRHTNVWLVLGTQQCLFFRYRSSISLRPEAERGIMAYKYQPLPPLSLVRVFSIHFIDNHDLRNLPASWCDGLFCHLVPVLMFFWFLHENTSCDTH